MDSSSSLPGRSSQPPKNSKWVNLIGGAIALLTLTIPPIIITYYSTNNSLDTLLPTTSRNEPEEAQAHKP